MPATGTVTLQLLNQGTETKEKNKRTVLLFSVKTATAKSPAFSAAAGGSNRILPLPFPGYPSHVLFCRSIPVNFRLPAANRFHYKGYFVRLSTYIPHKFRLFSHTNNKSYGGECIMSPKELSYIEDALGHESFSKTQFQQAIQNLQDGELKQCVTRLYEMHVQLFDRFFKLV